MYKKASVSFSTNINLGIYKIGSFSIDLYCAFLLNHDTMSSLRKHIYEEVSKCCSTSAVRLNCLAVASVWFQCSQVLKLYLSCLPFQVLSSRPEKQFEEINFDRFLNFITKLSTTLAVVGSWTFSYVLTGVASIACNFLFCTKPVKSYLF